MARVAIIDDDLAMDIFTDGLHFRGHDAYRIATVADALRGIERIVSADLVVLDIIMPWPQDRPATGLTGDRTQAWKFSEISEDKAKICPSLPIRRHRMPQ